MALRVVSASLDGTLDIVDTQYLTVTIEDTDGHQYDSVEATPTLKNAVDSNADPGTYALYPKPLHLTTTQLSDLSGGSNVELTFAIKTGSVDTASGSIDGRANAGDYLVNLQLKITVNEPNQRTIGIISSGPNGIIEIIN